MRKIQMVDLNQQYLHIKPEIDKAIHDVIDSAAFIKGPQVNSLEKELSEYLEVKYVVSCANGTDALQIALMALGLKPGDEVITASFTFIATVEVIALLGLKPVFVDADIETFNINPTQIEKAITPKTKAILPVHIFGQTADMDSIVDIAKRYNLFVIEDACQAMGASFKMKNKKMAKAGTIGDVGCTSFFPSKNLGCFGDGGAMFSNDKELAEQLQIIANHGMKERYYHDEIGVNSRLDSIQAAVLRVKLRHLDQYNESRRKAATYYDNALGGIKGIKIPYRCENSYHIFHQYTLKIEDYNRDNLKTFLDSKGIPAMIYYPVPIHIQNAYKEYGYKEGDLPITELLSKQVISLPMHSELDQEQLKYICDSLMEFFKAS